jgi:hypothetical protein
MRLKVILVLLAAGPLYAANPTEQTSQPIDHLATPTAEPMDGSAYAPADVDTGEGPTAADIGPVQKHFTMATEVDDLANQPNAPITDTVPGEPIALDKRVSVPLVHDVQDDSSYKSASNDSLIFEIKYLNWGAVTGAQLRARQGHYFTITFVNDGPPSDFTTCFEYREVKSKQLVRKLVQEKKHVHGAERAYFAVVNHAYLAYGPVSAWRFTVLRGNTVVAEAKSYLW